MSDEHKNWKNETLCVQEGYTPVNGGPRVLPIYQSTTYQFNSTQEVAQLFDMQAEGHMYTRISNPTVEALEKKISALEVGVGALCTSSGQSATFIALMNICEAGDHIVASSSIYGGTFNLFAVTLKKMGIQVTFIDPDATEKEIQKAFQSKTKLLFGETLANPRLSVLDIAKFARLAKANDVPLIIDNTFATPLFCRPFEFGAHIVVHSTTKYMDGHAVSVGGAVVDSGNFNWNNGKFLCLTEPDPSYHGVIYTETFGKAAYINKARFQYLRDLGSCMSPMNAFLTNLGMESLHVRMERHSQNALKAAEFLSKHPKVSKVNYPGLSSDPYHALAKKYLPKGCSGVLSFLVKGGKAPAVQFMDALKLAAIVVHVADARTSVLHPASSTHRQLTDDQLLQAGIDPGMVRLSVGIENIEDILADLKQALDKI